MCAGHQQFLELARIHGKSDIELYSFWIEGYCLTSVFCRQAKRPRKMSSHMQQFGTSSPYSVFFFQECDKPPLGDPYANNPKTRDVKFLHMSWKLWPWREMGWWHPLLIIISREPHITYMDSLHWLSLVSFCFATSLIWVVKTQVSCGMRQNFLSEVIGGLSSHNFRLTC